MEPPLIMRASVADPFFQLLPQLGLDADALLAQFEIERGQPFVPARKIWYLIDHVALCLEDPDFLLTHRDAFQARIDQTLLRGTANPRPNLHWALSQAVQNVNTRLTNARWFLDIRDDGVVKIGSRTPLIFDRGEWQSEQGFFCFVLALIEQIGLKIGDAFEAGTKTGREKCDFFTGHNIRFISHCSSAYLKFRVGTDSLITLPALSAMEQDQAINLRDLIHTLLANAPLNVQPSLSDMARTLNVTPRTLQRYLAQQHTQYGELRDQAWRDAVVLQLQKSRSIKAASYDLGYHNLSQFYARFQRCFGTTPKAFLSQQGETEAR
ncbi:helix-turn-helix domain-containing protein [Ferrimonas balearica]|uniref:helix-turn-helix domain-containing protein n=1 Tax=Ferrimonas balearica TaxID=44012 RepID=UPI001C94C151|nr:helix-turn-helix domain-containing protein [Ferrimonas balearica]MBY6226434.1 helix-turn-helix domain-containing protein [Ferrimonas balearica]